MGQNGVMDADGWEIRVQLASVGVGKARALVVVGEGTACARIGSGCGGPTGRCFTLDAEDACSTRDIFERDRSICTFSCLNKVRVPFCVNGMQGRRN